MTSNTLSPIALFTYNRLTHTKRTIEALQKNTLANESELLIYSDGARDAEDQKKIDELRLYLKTLSGFKKIKIFEKEKNAGLSSSIIDGVTKTVNEYGKIIVVEDDLVTSPYFLTYMNEAINLYQSSSDVVSISGYIYQLNTKNLPETFFIRGADCWGWATWKNGWDVFNPNGKELLAKLQEKDLRKEFEFNDSYPFIKILEDQIEGKNNSWAIRWYASAFLANKLTLYPRQTLVKNIGFDSSGTHCGSSDEFESELNLVKTTIKPIKIKENSAAKKAIAIFFKPRKSVASRIFKKIKRTLFLKK